MNIISRPTKAADGRTIRGRRQQRSGRSLTWILAAAAAALCVAAPIAFAAGYQSALPPFRESGFVLGLVALSAAGPAALVFAAALLLASLRTPDRLKGVDAFALDSAPLMESVAGAAAVLTRAETAVAELRRVLDEETGRIDQAAAATLRAGDSLAERLGPVLQALQAAEFQVLQGGSPDAQRIREIADLAREALQELESAVGRVQAEAETLPERARRHVSEVEAAVADAARRAAERSEAADALLQDRVRRHVDAVGQALRALTGSLGDPSPVTDGFSGRGPASRQAAGDSAPPMQRALSEADWAAAVRAATLPNRTSPPPPAASPDGPPEPAAPTPPSPLVAPLHRIGVRPDQLFSPGQLREVAAALQQGAPDRARDLVARAAARQVAQTARLLSQDPPWRNAALTFADTFRAELAQAAPPDTAATLQRIGSSPGRLFLLLEAARARGPA